MSTITSKNKALMRRVYEEMWNNGSPSLAVDLFDRPEGVEQFLLDF